MDYVKVPAASTLLAIVLASCSIGADDLKDAYELLKKSPEVRHQNLGVTWNRLTKAQSWSDVTGQHTTKASYLSHDANTVTLQKEDGSQIQVSLDKLGTAENNRVKVIRVIRPRIEDAMKELRPKKVEPQVEEQRQKDGLRKKTPEQIKAAEDFKCESVKFSHTYTDFTTIHEATALPGKLCTSMEAMCDVYEVRGKIANEARYAFFRNQVCKMRLSYYDDAAKRVGGDEGLMLRLTDMLGKYDWRFDLDRYIVYGWRIEDAGKAGRTIKLSVPKERGLAIEIDAVDEYMESLRANGEKKDVIDRSKKPAGF